MAQHAESYQHFIQDSPVDTTFPDAYKSHLITDIEILKTVLSTPVDLVAFDTETTGLNPEKDFIVGFSFSIDDHNGYYVPVKHFNGGLGTAALDEIYKYMCSCNTVAMHNCRFDMRMLEWHGFTDLNLKEQQMWLDLIPYEDNDKFKKFQREHYLRYDMSKIKYFDTQASCFLSDTNDQRTSLKKYEMKFLGWKSDTFEEALGDNSNWFYTDYNDYTTYRYASLDTIGTYNLAVKTKRFADEAKLSGQLDNNVLYPVGRVEELLQPIDRELLLKYHDELVKDREETQERCWSHAGRPFNLGSTKEKSEVLESLGVYTGARTKTGNMATGKGAIDKALEHMDKADPNYSFMQDLVHYNNVQKQLSSYVDNIIEMCEADVPLRKDMLRFNYKLTLVPTGRLAAGGDKKSNGFWANLNIQNIPKPHPADYHVISVEECEKTNPELLEAGRKEDGTLEDVWYYEWEGKKIKIDRIFNYLMTPIKWDKIITNKEGHTAKYPSTFPFKNESSTAKIMEGADQHLNIRSIFKPMSKDHYLMSLDYSGQELRACALLSGEPAWTEAFVHGKDVHRSTAEKIWGAENYDKEKRKKAKAANFGIIYGMGAYTLASRNGMTPEEGEEFYRQFQEGLPVLFSWISMVQKQGKKNGTVYTMFGRPRRVAYWYNHPDYRMHAFADRTCANTIVQGTAADISKIAIIKVYKNILSNPNNFDIVRWHSTVHDEINYHVRKDKAKLIAKEINKLMILRMANWPFSFETGLSFGNTWGSLFDFNYDLKTCEVGTPKWEDLGEKPVAYTGEVENKEEEHEVSLLINTEGEEFNWDI